MSAKKLLPKISSKAIVGDFSNSKKETTRLYQVYGKATGFKVIETNYGSSEQLNGNFEAVNLTTGELFSSNKAFLPTSANDEVMEVLKSGAKEIEFAFEIGSIPSSNNSGYEYTVLPLIDIKPVASLDDLRSKIGEPKLNPKTSKPAPKM